MYDRKAQDFIEIWGLQMGNPKDLLAASEEVRLLLLAKVALLGEQQSWRHGILR